MDDCIVAPGRTAFNPALTGGFWAAAGAAIPVLRGTSKLLKTRSPESFNSVPGHHHSKELSGIASCPPSPLSVRYYSARSGLERAFPFLASRVDVSAPLSCLLGKASAVRIVEHSET
jgi:hypothetical protein